MSYYSSTLSFSVHSLSYLSATMGYLLGCLRGRERERPAAFISLGLLAVAVGPAIKKYLPKIMEVIKASLPTKVCFQGLITLLFSICTFVFCSYVLFCCVYNNFVVSESRDTNILITLVRSQGVVEDECLPSPSN